MSEKKETPNSENAELTEEQAQAQQAEEQEQLEQKERGEEQEQSEQFEEQEPSEQQEQSGEEKQAEPEEHPEHHPVKQSSGSSAAFLATIIALAAIGASYYLWQQQQGLRKDVATLDSSVNRLVDVVAQHNTQQLARIEELSRHHHPQIEQKLVQVEQGLLELRSRMGQKRSAWVISEAEYLVRIASHRLTLERDTLTAAAALSEAANRLRQLKDPSLSSVIAHIDNDIATIKAISLPDRDVMASRLAQIASEIPQWPFATGDHQSTAKPVQPESENAPAETNTPTQRGWRQTLARMWEDIKSLVTIRHNDEVNKPVTDTEQRFFLQQNLRLKFESARLALLSGQTTAYHGSLEEARNWIQRYFDTSNPKVAEALASMQQLNSIEFNQPLPSLNNTLILLQKAALAAQPAVETPSLPNVAKPATEQPKAPESPSATEQAPASEPNTSSEPTPAPDSTPPAEQPPADKPTPDSSESPTEKTPPAGDVPSVPQGVAL